MAFGLRLLFRRTRLGVAMRAVVDNPELCAIKGLSPNRVTAASWALGSMLAGLAAILIAPGLNLEVNTLSLLVVSAYAAAVVGRMQSLPATFVGALVLGISQTLVVGYLPQDNELVRNLKPALPFLLLFAALLLRPGAAPARAGRGPTPSPTRRRCGPPCSSGSAARGRRRGSRRAGCPTTSSSSARRACCSAASRSASCC